MAHLKNVVIASACRTPIGSFNGQLSGIPAPKLGAVAIAEAVKRANIKPGQVEQVIMGCVLSAGLGQAPARQAAIFAGLPKGTDCTTVNKVCSSGLKAVMLGTQAVRVGESNIVVAGGMENMSMAPYLLEKARTGYRLGHGQIVDSMVKDGLWDVYNDYHMGNAAELCATTLEFSREDQDSFAAESYRRALDAIKTGRFKAEITPVEVPQRKGDPVTIDTDEEPPKGIPEKFPKLRPAFDKDGTVTAANASSINDAASALVLMSEEKASELGIDPLAKVIACATASKEPEWFTTAPSDAVNKALESADLAIDDIDLFEINEAFSCVSLANNKILQLDPEKVNVNGGAVALGHPIGASGARILTTLLYAMKNRNAKKGIAAICNGGGEATAVIVELM